MSSIIGVRSRDRGFKVKPETRSLSDDEFFAKKEGNDSIINALSFHTTSKRATTVLSVTSTASSP